MKDLSIITVTWKSKELIAPFIESIQRHTQGISYEIIVVENNSGDGIVEFLKERFPGVVVLPQSNNLGYAQGMRAGFAVASGKVIAFMNPDMSIDRNVFPLLIDKLEQNPKIGIIAPQLRYPDHTVQHTVKRDPSLQDQLLILLKLHHVLKTKKLQYYLAKDFDYSQEQPVDQLMGAFIMSKRENLQKFNWDPEYPLWWEDIQICKDSRKSGFINFYTPSTYVIHHEGKSFAQISSLPKQRRFNKGMRIYFLKNFSFLSYLLLLFLNPFSLALAWTAQTLKIKPKPQSKI